MLLAVGFPPAARAWKWHEKQNKNKNKNNKERNAFKIQNEDDELHLSSFFARAAGTCTHSSNDWRCGALSSGLKLMESIMENSRPDTGKALGFCKGFFVWNDCY
jgi:hypothetical protein